MKLVPGEVRYAGAYQLVMIEGDTRGYYCEVQAPIRNGEFDEVERLRRVDEICRAVNAAHTGNA